MSDAVPTSVAVKLVEGDIARETVDAVVNAANNHFWMGGGVAGALKRAGGPELETEAMRRGPVEPGESITTTGGRLPARHCIHAAVMGQDLATDAGLIRAATRSALRRADELRARSVAFPALGTGVGGFPPAEAARLMLEVVLEEAPTTSVREVRFVLFSRAVYDAFAAALAAARPAGTK